MTMPLKVFRTLTWVEALVLHLLGILQTPLTIQLDGQSQNSHQSMETIGNLSLLSLVMWY
uniref:Uncharacterized protein n=1 Tax=Brassica oleracea TaxID=3712 RepID=A0A3P6FIZ6_BRAOL|nr:unnamed protein product [Brassica oleracea]